MDIPALCDPAVYPTNRVLRSHLGKARASFVSLVKYNHDNFPEFAERWKYYNDGKSWLLNVSRKKKTLFWLSVMDGSFRVSFYLGAKAAQAVAGSNIPKPFKTQFTSPAGGKLRRISLIVRKKKDLDIYRELLALKMSC